MSAEYRQLERKGICRCCGGTIQEKSDKVIVFHSKRRKDGLQIICVNCVEDMISLLPNTDLKQAAEELKTEVNNLLTTFQNYETIATSSKENLRSYLQRFDLSIETEEEK